ncbi:MAG: hypothetical protein KDE23_27755, partial [Caldilinea sp.]|nr:hypothetical protein [Caldilinea sp.]
MDVIERVLEEHGRYNVLIIGQYLNQLEEISKHFDFPIITGKTPLQERERLYSAFRSGEIT